MSVRVVLADRERLVRDLMTSELTRFGLEVTAAVSTAEELGHAVDDGLAEVIVVSDPLAGRSVAELLPELARTGAKVIVLSHQLDPDRVTDALERGAVGYLLHDMEPDELARAVTAVAELGAALHFRVAALLLGQWRAFRQDHPRLALSLTPRELEILSGLARGDTTKAMAARLGIAQKTVESHRLRLFDKLGAKSQAHAVSIAASLGLLPPDRPEQPGAGDGRTGPDQRGHPPGSPLRGIWG